MEEHDLSGHSMNEAVVPEKNKNLFVLKVVDNKCAVTVSCTQTYNS